MHPWNPRLLCPIHANIVFRRPQQAMQSPGLQAAQMEHPPAALLTMRAQAMEPFFSVLLSALFLGESPSAPVLAALLPVVGGVALASASEVTFNW